MDVAVKICGLTRAEDAAAAAHAGASYVGVVFAGGPRKVDPERGCEILDAGGAQVLRVGVFGPGPVRQLLEVAMAARLDVMQLHGDPTVRDVIAVRDAFAGKCWAVVRSRDGTLPQDSHDLFAVADAIVLDTRVAGNLGGSGVPLPWSTVSSQIEPVRHNTSIVLAGGLTPENVAEAIRAVRPAVVDVSSGVESSPGIKDHARIRAFISAAQQAGAVTA